MRPKSIMLLVLAAGCGLVASIGINQAMSRPNVEQIPTDSTEIFVAKSEIGLGDSLKPEVLKLESWPTDKVPAGALTKLEETVERRSRTKIYPGEPIIEAKLLAKGEDVADAATMIPKGMRVVSIRVDAVSGAASLIKPGDRVDVLVHLQENTSRGITKTTTKTFLQHVKVFAVDDVFRRENDGGQTVAAKTISLLVTPTQAELVTMASELGTLRLVMRSASDEDKSETPGSTPSGSAWPRLCSGVGRHRRFVCPGAWCRRRANRGRRRRRCSPRLSSRADAGRAPRSFHDEDAVGTRRRARGRFRRRAPGARRQGRLTARPPSSNNPSGFRSVWRIRTTNAPRPVSQRRIQAVR